MRIVELMNVVEKFQKTVHQYFLGILRITHIAHTHPHQAVDVGIVHPTLGKRATFFEFFDEGLFHLQCAFKGYYADGTPRVA